MQELWEYIDANYHEEGFNLYDAKEISLEKEKEQIINAYVDGFNISGEGWNGEYGINYLNNIKEEIEAEEYYNQTYNK